MSTSLQRSHFIQLLTRTIHIMKRLRRRHGNNEEPSSVGDRRRKLIGAMAAPKAHHDRKIYDGNKKKPAAAAGVLRVKLVLTRKEAARLVSLAGEGRRRTAVQLLRELRRMDDAGLVDGSPATAWKPVLEIISEEW
uniref:Uncharacterized protein n=1 Tax=Leersia perrieri TaxID=77586 RepID=A0A0D9WDV3_9ORYZ